MTVALPAETACSTPVVPAIVATEDGLQLQLPVPTLAESLSVVIDEAQTDDEPNINPASGSALTLSVSVTPCEPHAFPSV